MESCDGVPCDDVPQRPGVSPATLRAAGIKFSDYPEPGSIEIPYTEDFSRWRLAAPRPDGQKYHQEPGTGVHLYYPPLSFDRNGTPLFGLADHYVVLPEGELKALALAELKVYAIGLPGINTYLKDKETGSRQLLPELQATLAQEGIENIYFLGDADTYASYAFARNAAFLANAVRPAKVYLPRLPLNGPGKGVDDCKEVLGDKFGAFFTNVITEAIQLLRECDPSMVACLILEREETALAALDGIEKQQQFDRIVRMCAEAELSEGKSQATTHLHKLARRILKFKITEFKNAVEVEISKIRGHSRNGQRSSNENETIVQELGWPFHFTQTSYIINPPYFARLWGSKRLALYDQASETFYHYLSDKGLFTPLRENEIRRLIIEDLFAEALRNGLPNIGSKITPMCQRGIIELIKSDREVCHKNFFETDNTAEPVIHVANGMVCISGAGIELRAFDPKYKSRNQIPIAYKPGAPCNRFLTEFLGKVLDANDIEMLQRYCGLILIGGNRAQKILFLLGKGGTGKGTIVRLIVLILGSSNVEQLRVDKLNERFETSRLIGKLLLNVVEAPEDFFSRPGAEIVKALCGHDVMNAEKKGVNESMGLAGLFPVIVSSNEQLRVRLAGDEESWERRILIIDFPRPREPGAEIIDNFEQVLVREEGEGILAWMIEGAKKHWDELVSHKGFGSTPTQKKHVNNLLARSKSIEIFVQTEIREAPTKNVTVGELYDAYSRFCRSRGWPPVREQTFETDSRRFIGEHWGVLRSNSISRNGKDKRGYRGLTISPAPPEKESGSNEGGTGPSGTPENGGGPISSPEPEKPSVPGPLPGQIEEPTDCAATPDKAVCVALDLETNGAGKFSKKGRFIKDEAALSPWKGQIRLVTWTIDGRAIHQHDLKQQGPLPTLALKTLTKATWVAHHAKFEMLFLAKLTGIIPKSVFCTMTASRLLTNGCNGEETLSSEEGAEALPAAESKKKKAKKLNSLASVLSRHLDVRLPKELGKASYWGGNLTPEQIEYARNDVRYLLPLAKKLKSTLAAEGLEEAFELECRLLPVVARMELHGFAIDRVTLGKRLGVMREETAAAEASVRTVLGEGAPLLGDSRGMKVWLQGLGATLDGEALADVAEETLVRCKHPAAKTLVSFRQAKKKCDVAEALLEASADDGRIHASFNTLGPKTGRFACSEPNIQNISRQKGLFRDLFVSSAPDRILVIADYSCIEMRIAALVAPDEIMQQAFRDGADIHEKTAAAVLGRPGTKVSREDRQRAKAGGFGFLYGQAAKGFLVYARTTYGLEFTLEEATVFRKMFFQQYPGLAAWHREARTDADFVTETRTVSGRRQLLSAEDSSWARFQALTNTVVQGSAADLIKLAMIKVDALLPSQSHLVMTCHDELVVDSPLAQAAEAEAVLKAGMEEAFVELFGRTIPINVEVKSCNNWEGKDKKEV